MENTKRVLWTAAGSIGAAGLLGLGAWISVERSAEDPARYQGWMTEAPIPAPAPLTADEHVQAVVPALFAMHEETVSEALDAIETLLAAAQPGEITDLTREETASALADLYVEADPATPEGVERQARVARLLVTQVKGGKAGEFAARIIETGTAPVRAAAARALLEPGATRDKRVAAAAYELAKQGLVPEADRPGLIRRAKGKASREELLAMLDSAESDHAVRRTAVELQNLLDPGLLGPVLERLDERGMLSDHKRMPWLSGKLLAGHIAKAEGAGLIRALQAVWLRPSLTKATFKTVESRLADADPAIRRMVARLVPEAVEYEALDAQTGEAMLSARLQVETDPAVQGQIAGALGEVQTLRRGVAETAGAPAD